MANEEHLTILKQGVEVWNKWRIENPKTEADLSQANLRGTTLSGASLSGADLSQANLSQANLRQVDLSQTNLRWANLFRANLRWANLSQANLSQATLSRTALREADLRWANLSQADLSEADLSQADLSQADLSQVNLSQATLVRTNLKQANLTGCYMYGISAWDVNLEGAKQSELVITPHDQPMIKVDDLEVAQLVYLLLNREKLRNVLNAVTGKGVLILGRFGDGGLEVLQAIAQKLRDLEYLPMIFDFERPESRNYTETVKTMAGLSRFIIADLSGPSVPQELYATIPHFKIPFVPIIDKDRRKFAMFVDLLEYPWVLDPVPFENKEQLITLIPDKVIVPAEAKHQERQKRLDELFN